MSSGKLLVDTSVKVVDLLHSAFQHTACYQSSVDSCQVTINLDALRVMDLEQVLVESLNADQDGLSLNELSNYQTVVAIC